MPTILTQKEFEKEMKVSFPTTKKWREAGMPFMQLGNRSIRYDFDECLSWVKKQSLPNQAKPKKKPAATKVKKAVKK